MTMVSANPVGIKCQVPRAPQISISPATKEIEYDFTKTENELGEFQTNTVNPYGASADTATGGIRHDKPEMSIQVKVGYQEYPGAKLVCLWYDSVNIGIQLQPKIYIASDLDGGETCHAAVMEHEKTHVKVDREVMNNFAVDIGQSISEAVNATAAIGPFPISELQAVQEQMTEQIKSTMKARQFVMNQEMNRRQGEVDSLAEYERISAICNQARRR